MIKVYYFFIPFLVLIACQQQITSEINAEKLKELQAQGVPVIDVRTPAEYSQGHIPGSTLINYRDPDFIKNMNAFDKNDAVVIHCASGGRSNRAMKLLQDQGFSQAYDYSGGFSDWKRRGERIEK